MLENKSGEPRFLRWSIIIDIKKDVCKDISQRAEDGTQTRDPQLGRLMLYRLSYFRIFCGQRWIRTTEGVSQQIYSLPHLATLVLAPFKKWSGRRDSNPRPSAWKANALSTELLPHFLWAKMDSNHRRRKPADLQSAPFGHSGICPFAFEKLLINFVSQLRCKGTIIFLICK